MKLAVVGTGLIGASVGLAARERLGATVCGVDPEPGPALSAGALDGAGTLEEALDGAEAAVVAVPMDALCETVARVTAAAPEGCLVTDTGSVKRPVVDAVADGCFVGGHPLAGAETGGAAAARADLFAGATWYLTPTRATSGMVLERAHRLVSGLGARPAVLDPVTHDRVMAAVSHLPHVLANVLVRQAAGALGGEGVPATGPSFRDATRVAGANPPLWEGIYAANADALMAEIDAAVSALGEVRERLAAGEGLGAWQQEAAAARDALSAATTGEDLAEVRLVVPNRPGVIADVALTLAREGVNIADMSLAPSRDMATGSLTLWVPAARAGRTRELLAAELGLEA